MSPDKITEARKEFSAFSKDQLGSKDFKLVELRRIAPKVGISRVNRDGDSVSVNMARKEELATAISEACQAYQDVKSEEKREIEADYGNLEEEQNRVAHKYYEGVYDANKKEWKLKGLRECAKEMVESQSMFPPSELMVLPISLKNELEARILHRVNEKADKKVTEANPRTLSNWRSAVLKKIERLVDADNSQFPDDILAKLFSSFDKAVRETMREATVTKYQQTNINLNTRQDNVLDIKVAPMILWAKDTLTNLPDAGSAYKDVAVAIIVLTGRRQSEVMSSGSFELTGDDDRLMFSGQLKRHVDESVEAFEIPVLANAAQAVVDGIQWLESHGKRETPEDNSPESQKKAAKKAHDRFSRYLSAKAKEICDKYIVIEAGGNWENEDGKGKMKDRRTCHLFRQIYGQIAIPVFFPQGRKPKQILTEIMGHSNYASSRKHAAEAYDADVEVKDIEAIKAIS